MKLMNAAAVLGLGILLNACASKTPPAPRSPEQAKFDQELAKLADESQNWAGRCEQFGAQARQEIKSLSVGRSLALLKKYPGLPAPTRKLYEKVARELGRYPLANTSAVLKAETCKLYNYFELFTALSSATSAKGGLRIDDRTRREMSQTIVARVREDLKGSVPALHVMIGTSLLASLADDRIIVVGAPVAKELRKLQDEAYALSNDVKKLRDKAPDQDTQYADYSDADWRAHNDALLSELRRSDALRVRLLAVANKLGK